MKNYEEKRIERKHKGFTLVELVVVVAIVAVLAVIAVPRFVSMTEGSKVATMEQNHGVIRTAITMYMADNNGKTPSDGTTGSGTNLSDVIKYIADVPSTATDITYLNNKPKDASYTWAKDTTSGKWTLTSKIPVNKGFDADDRAGTTTATATADGVYIVTFSPE